MKEIFLVYIAFIIGIFSTNHYNYDESLNGTHTFNNYSIESPLMDDVASRILPTKNMCVRADQSQEIGVRIFGGNPAKLGDWPWIVALGYQHVNSFAIAWRCAGSLITKKHVLTAAHCVYNLGESKLTTARLGVLDFHHSNFHGIKALDVPVKLIKTHPDYNSDKNTNDITVLVLNENVDFNDTIRPICLPIKFHGWPSVDFDGSAVFVAGWGRTNPNHINSENKTLMEVKVPLVPYGKCKNIYQGAEFPINYRVMCAGEEGKDACQGDSGGPLMFRNNDQYFLLGIVSFGFVECGTRPGVYTRVSSFEQWILESIVEK